MNFKNEPSVRYYSVEKRLHKVIVVLLSFTLLFGSSTGLFVSLWLDAKDNQKIVEQASTSPWLDKVTITGISSPESISELLTVADAVVLPFRGGEGESHQGGQTDSGVHRWLVERYV